MIMIKDKTKCSMQNDMYSIKCTQLIQHHLQKRLPLRCILCRAKVSRMLLLLNFVTASVKRWSVQVFRMFLPPNRFYGSSKTNEGGEVVSAKSHRCPSISLISSFTSGIHPHSPKIRKKSLDFNFQNIKILLFLLRYVRNKRRKYHYFAS